MRCLSGALPTPSPHCREAYSYIQRLCRLCRGPTLRIRLCCSFLRACLRVACAIGSLLLALFLQDAVQFLAFPLPFSLHYIAMGVATLALAMMLPMEMELLVGTMQAF